MKITVEIWSDFVCPFCYMGKRQFEKALALFEHRERLEVTWKSYQLHPDAKNEHNKMFIPTSPNLRGRAGNGR